MAGKNGDSNGSNDLPQRDVRLAAAIGAAVGEALIPAIANVAQAVETVRGEVGALRAELIPRLDTLTTKVDQLQSGAVGVGRMAALEERVSSLEGKFKT